jgi:Bacterial capsule synthesis protein PGA_cap
MIDLARCSDAAFNNLEMLFHNFEPYPASESGGTYLRADPSIVDELVCARFDMVARANNDTTAGPRTDTGTLRACTDCLNGPCGSSSQKCDVCWDARFSRLL